MRIAVLASTVYPVPYEFGGGAEWATYYAATALQRLGHDVTLFAGEGSQFDKLIVIPQSPNGERDIALIAEEYAAAFDLFYDCTHMHLFARWHPNLPILVQAHDREPYHRGLPNLIANSRDHQAEIGARWVMISGIDTDKYVPSGDVGVYALWFGRNTPDKNLPDAEDAARAVGMPLVARGPGLLDGPAGQAEKLELIRSAKVYLATALRECGPVSVMEAQACGVPVVCLNAGGTPEYICDGVTGKVCAHPEDLPAAIREVVQYDRGAIRDWAVKMFSLEALGKRLEAIINEFIGERVGANPR